MRILIISKKHIDQLPGQILIAAAHNGYDAIAVPLAKMVEQTSPEDTRMLVTDLIHAFQPDVLLWMNMADFALDSWLAERIVESAVLHETMIVYFSFDDPQRIWYRKSLNLAPHPAEVHADRIATCDWTTSTIEYYTSINDKVRRNPKRILFLPPPIPNLPFRRQEFGGVVMFVTNLYEGKPYSDWGALNRRKLIETLLEHEIEVHVFGPDRLRLPKGVEYHGYLPYHQFGRLLGSVVINTHVTDSPGYLNARFFECFGIGAYQITEDKPIIHKLLRDYKNEQFLTDMLRLCERDYESFALAAKWIWKNAKATSIPGKFLERFSVRQWLRDLVSGKTWLSLDDAIDWRKEL